MKTFSETRLERREFKYLVPSDAVQGVRAAVRSVCRPDRHAGPDGTYLVRSLYLDTDALDLFWANEREQPDRFKARIRCYPDASAAPVFLEIKRRVLDTIVKTRAPVPPTRLGELLDASGGPRSLAELGAGARDAERFLALVHGYHLRPRLLVEYVREPYFSDLDVYARVTFDTAIVCQARTTFDLAADPKRWRVVDRPLRTVMDPAATLVELKFGSVAPAWMSAMVARFDLVRHSFSKYGHGVRAEHALPAHRAAARLAV